ncbi:unnamed protein product [Symbiodinium natans]|uniref:Uncharacterized protein n=1 Tax=Symbiodinium natans TaxID=878477 RepID=A0A812PHE5_9DINO|nr:unnamed protein product [Symbiodinium natans]
MDTCGTLVDRRFIVEVDNRTEENMILDGELFESGGWQRKENSLKSKEVTKLEFVSTEVFHGLSGLLWYVSEKSLDTR